MLLMDSCDRDVKIGANFSISQNQETVAYRAKYIHEIVYLFFFKFFSMAF